MLERDKLDKSSEEAALIRLKEEIIQQQKHLIEVRETAIRNHSKTISDQLMQIEKLKHKLGLGSEYFTDAATQYDPPPKKKIYSQLMTKTRNSLEYQPFDDDDRPHSRSPPSFIRDGPAETEPYIKITHLDEVEIT